MIFFLEVLFFKSITSSLEMKILTNTFSVFTYLCVIIFRLKKGPKDLKNYCKKNHQFDCCFTSGLTMFRSYENVTIALKDFKFRPMLFIYGLWAGRNLYRNRGSWVFRYLSQRTSSFQTKSHLRQAKGTEDLV